MLKVPPKAIEAEQSVLGSLLIDRECFITIGDMLVSEDFYDEANSKIYEVMYDLYKNNSPIDLITVKEKLDDRKYLDKIGGITYLTELTEIVPTTANIYEYAVIVKNKSVLRKLIRTGNEIIASGYDEEESVNVLLEKAEKLLFSVTQIFIKNKLVHINEILTGRYEEFAEIHENPDSIKLHRLYSGFESLDNTMGGVKGGDMIILAARPSMGKTAFALNLAQNIGFNNKNVAIFSLEMSKEQLTDRMIASTMGIDSWKLSKGELEDEEFAKIGDAMEKLSAANIYIDDSAGGNLLDFKSKCRRLKMESGLDLVIIDYLQLMSNGNNLNRVQEVSEISRGIKSLARELDVPIIALSQLSRGVESRPDKRPIMSDLRESGSIEQDADIVMMLYREDYYDEFSEKKGVTDIFIRKNRNGPIGNIELDFNKNNQRFEERKVTAGYNGGE
ncbi:replicative DNA helicase [Candidatus Gracilibacteria bacterium]|nr:MAG: replicative DNA helicase [Candidatus Gracilibacteria bacterium]PIE85782.1 MAG: replicative DNA helicase [Candidatus Gracilibacteria bacterium]